MNRRVLLVAALLVFLAASVWAIAVPPRLTCASLSYPEGTRCAEGRIDLEHHGPFVSVHVDRLLPLRLGIIAAGTVLASALLIIHERSFRART